MCVCVPVHCIASILCGPSKRVKALSDVFCKIVFKKKIRQ